ncbi:MAG: DUF2182 domain-containing protein, partial [Gaiellaceae bacterium]
AWAGVAAQDAMPMGAAAFVASWGLMMTAMMLPSAAPLVLVYRRSRAGLVAGYLAVWLATAVPAYAAAMLVPDSSRFLAAVLIAAGVYQLTPLKSACLRRCRSPLDFLMTRWRRGAVRVGLEHGAYCVGCCWSLMAVLVVAGAMSLAWAAAIAALVLAEKVAPAGERVATVAGLALVAAGVVVAIP